MSWASFSTSTLREMIMAHHTKDNEYVSYKEHCNFFKSRGTGGIPLLGMSDLMLDRKAIYEQYIKLTLAVPPRSENDYLDEWYGLTLKPLELLFWAGVYPVLAVISLSASIVFAPVAIANLFFASRGQQGYDVMLISGLLAGSAYFLLQSAIAITLAVSCLVTRAISILPKTVMYALNSSSTSNPERSHILNP